MTAEPATGSSAAGLERLTALMGGIAVRDAPPEGPPAAAWWHLPDAVDRMPERLDRVAVGVGRRDAATSFLGGWAVAPMVQVTTAPAILDRDLVPLRLDDVHLRAHPGGWFDGIALGGIGHVTRGADLEARWARQAADVLTPVLDAVHAAGERFGLRGLWGVAVVDRVLWTATDLAERGYGDAGTLVRRAQSLLDALEPLAPVRLTRARTMTVPGPAGDVTFPVKSACCLLYKTIPPRLRTPDQYCTGCPILPDDTRAPRWRAYLAGQQQSTP
jgi:hypothetical protein